MSRVVNFLKYLLLLAVIISMVACNDDDDDLESVEDLTLNFDRLGLLANGFDEIRGVVSYLGEDVTDASEIFIDGEPIEGNVFKTTESGEYYVFARYRNYQTADVKIGAIEPKECPLIFRKNNLIENYTASWQKYWPEFERNQRKLLNEYGNIIQVNVYNDTTLGFDQTDNLMDYFGLKSYPVGFVNRQVSWDLETDISPTYLTELYEEECKIGLKMKSYRENDTIQVRVDVGFGDVSIDTTYSLIVYLLQDSLIYPQADHYFDGTGNSFTYSGGVVEDYMHNNVLIQSATNVFGDVIPEYAYIKGNAFSLDFSFDVFGNKHHSRKFKIVAFVMTATEPHIVLNAQQVHVGDSTLF